jgi:hypothetical protein
MSIFFTDSDTGWTVGNIGTILHTTDGGATGIEENEDRAQGKRTWELTTYPNPFTTRVQISLLGETVNRRTGIQIFDISGRKVREISLLPFSFLLGAKTTWNGRDDEGRALPPGIYFIAVGGQIEKKIVKIK